MGKDRIFLIDDRQANVEMLTALLEGQGYSVESADGGMEILRAVRTSAPDLILLAADRPGFDGYELCRRLKLDRATCRIPIIFLEPEDRAQVFAAGGADFVTSPLLKDEVLARVKVQHKLRAARMQLDESEARLERADADLALVEADRDMLRVALREAEEKGQDLIENLSEVIYMFDQRGVLTYVSPSIERFLGYPPSEAIGRHFCDFLHPDELPRVEKNVQRVLAGDLSAQEYQGLTKSGEVRWMRTSSQPVFEGERVAGVQGVLIDITESKEVEEALDQLSHELAERVKELKCLYSISALAARPDLSLDEILARIVVLIPPGFLHPEVTGAQILWEGQEFRTQNFEETPWILDAELAVHGRPVGILRVCHLASGSKQNGSPFLGEHQDLVDTIAGRLVVTAERIEVAEQLRQHNHFLMQVLESLTHPFYVVDVKDYSIGIANSAAQVQAELGQATCYALTHGRSQPCDGADHPCPLEEIKRTKKPARVEHVHYDQEGTPRNVEVHGYPLFDGEGELARVIEYSLDITDRRQAERALLAAKEEAEQARRQEGERRREAERRRRIAESLVDVLAALNSSQPLDQILDYIAARASQLLDNQAVVLCRRRDSDGALVIQASQGLSQSMLEETRELPGRDPLVEALSASQPLIIPDLAAGSGDASHLATDGSVARPVGPDADPFRALLAVPVVVKGEVYGGFVLYYNLPQTFSYEELDLALAFSDQTALAIENAWLREQVELAAASAERNRLARDLHDSVTQALFSASLVAEVLPQVWRRNPDEALQGVEELRRLTRAALSEMRTLLLELRPTALLETDLNDLLGQLAEALSSRVQLQVSLDLEPIPTLPPDVHVTFYRVAQEALNNAVNHGAARQLIVSLHASPPLAVVSLDQWQGQVILHVSDDGKGFDPGSVAQDHLGLEIMRERALGVGAVLTVDSQLGQGTQISLVWHKR